MVNKIEQVVAGCHKRLAPGFDNQAEVWCSGAGTKFSEEIKMARCPVCRKLLTLKIIVIHSYPDAEELIKEVPPHKIRGWWRKPKIKKKEKNVRKRFGKKR